MTVIGDPNGDELTGGAGRDRFRVRDGEVDVVHCGEGRDHVDRRPVRPVDADCEHERQSDITSLDQVEDGEENRGREPAGGRPGEG